MRFLFTVRKRRIVRILYSAILYLLSRTWLLWLGSLQEPHQPKTNDVKTNCKASYIQSGILTLAAIEGKYQVNLEPQISARLSTTQPSKTSKYPTKVCLSEPTRTSKDLCQLVLAPLLVAKHHQSFFDSIRSI